jgi:hypothetical protein
MVANLQGERWEEGEGRGQEEREREIDREEERGKYGNKERKGEKEENTKHDWSAFETSHYHTSKMRNPPSSPSLYLASNCAKSPDTVPTRTLPGPLFPHEGTWAAVRIGLGSEASQGQALAMLPPNWPSFTPPLPHPHLTVSRVAPQASQPPANMPRLWQIPNIALEGSVLSCAPRPSPSQPTDCWLRPQPAHPA